MLRSIEYAAWNVICSFIEEQSHEQQARVGETTGTSLTDRMGERERTWELITEIYRTAPHHLADYANAMQHDLIDKWECKSIRLKALVEKSKRLTSHATTPTLHVRCPSSPKSVP